MDYKTVQSKNVTIEVYGLGYVGLPLATRLAAAGFRVVGIDKDTAKIERIKSGTLLDSEEFLRKDFDVAKKSGMLSVSQHATETQEPKIGIICVPTPIPHNGITSDVFVMQATEAFVSHAKKGDIIILESSIEIGTTDRVQKTIESKGFNTGNDFGLAFCPERIDPKNKKWNLENIPRIIYCSDDETYNACRQVYRYVNDANLRRVSSAKIAEVVKSFENAFRLVNISLVNELAVLCDKLKIDVREIIDAAATKPFGFMPFYPGAGAGGHCIPKDPRFLLASAEKFGVSLDTLQNALLTNIDISKYIANEIVSTIQKNNLPMSAIVCGLAYKPDIEDMRDSPGFRILANLAKSSVRVVAYDPYYSEESRQKYIIENNLDEETEKFGVLKDISKDSVAGFGCMCIVQHHTKTRFDIQQILKDKSVPFIYDCQGRLDDTGSVILKKFGG